MAKDSSPAYEVEAQSDIRSGGTKFGPFATLENAEDCVLVLAGRSDIKSATIKEINCWRRILN